MECASSAHNHIVRFRSRQEFEKSIVPWQRGGNIPRCPHCKCDFRPLLNPRDHCRLCGWVRGGRGGVSRFVSVPHATVPLTPHWAPVSPHTSLGPRDREVVCTRSTCSEARFLNEIMSHVRVKGPRSGSGDSGEGCVVLVCVRCEQALHAAGRKARIRWALHGWLLMCATV